MPLLSALARRKKEDFFLCKIPRGARVLEVGPGDGWVHAIAKSLGWNYVSLDVQPGIADVTANIGDLTTIPLFPGEVDVVIAFEVIEHVDLVATCHALLRRQGLLMLTTPLPAMDWALRLLEFAGLNQRRTSPHTNLVDIRNLAGFETDEYRIVAGLSQWGIYRRM